MKVVVALDSFKGSVSSLEAGRAVRHGVLLADPEAEVSVVPVADGGEGTVAAVLACSPEAREVAVQTVDPVGRPVTASYALLERAGTTTAVLEAASVIGLGMLDRVDSTAPPRAHSGGLATVLRHALDAADRVLLGLGGTASTDGGTGLLLAWDSPPPRHNPLWHGGDLPGALPDLSRVVVLTDVANPLLGASGAAAVFGPQKGADAAQVRRLERGMERWADLLEELSGRQVARAPGAGAAGGLGAALLACGARLEPGFTRLAAEIGLVGLFAGADVVFTGEGSLDAQTTMGKAPQGVAVLAREAGALVVGLAGRVERPAPGVAWPFDVALAIHSRLRPLEEALDPTITCAELSATAAEAVRLLRHRVP
ncbi:putative Glycerate kinase [metagenome]|uniref:Putative Glycerate kinase n=1 Tax=metagenome TaxID=256318 RepID=A0A2P2CET8_9ZZZZ